MKLLVILREFVQMLQLAEFLTNLRELLVITIQLCYEVRLACYGMSQQYLKTYADSLNYITCSSKLLCHSM